MQRVPPRCRLAHLPTCRRWSPDAVSGPFGSLVCAYIGRSSVGRRLLTGETSPAAAVPTSPRWRRGPTFRLSLTPLSDSFLLCKPSLRILLRRQSVPFLQDRDQASSARQARFFQDGPRDPPRSSGASPLNVTRKGLLVPGEVQTGTPLLLLAGQGGFLGCCGNAAVEPCGTKTCCAAPQ